MRWSKHQHSGAPDDPRFRCCGCCHVQTGSILLGLYNLMTQAVLVCGLIYAIWHPEVFICDNGDMMQATTVGSGFIPAIPTDHKPVMMADVDVENVNPLFVYKAKIEREKLANGIEAVNVQIDELPQPMPLKQEDTPNGAVVTYSKSDVMVFTHRRVVSGDAHLALGLVLGLMFITFCMIYGAAKGRPVYILPFFCFQVFDFVLACLTAVGHYTWLPNIHEAIVSSPDMPFREDLMKVNSQWIAMFVLILYVLALVIKAYFIGVVWSCYQFLHLRNVMVRRYVLDDAEQQMELLPPNYDEAMQMPKENFVPPPVYAPPPEYTSKAEEAK